MTPVTGGGPAGADPDAMSAAQVGDRISGLTPQKRALLEKKLLELRRRAVDDSIPRRQPGDPAPLSFSQQRLWFLEQLNPGSPTYNAALAMRITGRLDVAALHRALRTVIARHESLRTTFVVVDGSPEQRVLDEWSTDLPVVDLRGVDSARRTAEAAAIMRERARRPYDLVSDLLLRATVVRTDDEEWLLLIEEHHIAFDGWSDGILFQELAEVYDAELEQRPPVLAELPIQYPDFALWQRRHLTGAVLEDHVAYWRRQLRGAPSTLDLPLDRPRPVRQSYEGAHHFFTLPRAVADAVRELSQAEGATVFMTLLAAFCTLLYRVTGEDDILIGTPIANRNRVELEGLIGFFSNTLVLRTRLGGNPTFRQVIAGARETALGAYAHQDLPFEKVVEAVRPARDPSVNPLFQVNFRVQSDPAPALRLGGTSITPVDIDLGFSRFDLALELQVQPDALRGYFEYNVAIFDLEPIQRLTDEFANLLGQLVAQPDTPVLAYDLISAAAPAPGHDSRDRRPRIKSFRDRWPATAP
jgi:hypothetical protein